MSTTKLSDEELDAFDKVANDLEFAERRLSASAKVEIGVIKAKQIIAELRESRAKLTKVKGLVDAVNKTIARADDYADSYITQPIRAAIKDFGAGR